MKTAFLGAGYISKFHASVRSDFDFVGAADLDLDRAKGLKAKNSFTSLKELLELHPEVVHILTPPDSHAEDILSVLKAGSHAFVEKPMCIKNEEASHIEEVSHTQNLKVGTNHNFLFYPVYEALKEAILIGELGEIDHITVTWQRELPHLFNFDNRHLILEIGSHLASIMIDLIGYPDTFTVEASDEIEGRFRRYLIIAYKGKTCIELRISLRQGMEERSIEVRGFGGKAKVDFDANTFILKRNSGFSLDFDRFLASRGEAISLHKQGFSTLSNYILGKFKLSKVKDPYSYSIENSIRTFYRNLPNIIDVRHASGPYVVKFCNAVADKLREPNKKVFSRTATHPKILVLGGSGFIGKALIKALNKPVRVMSRSRFEHENVQTLKGTLENEEDVKRALEGIDTVYHLARANVSTWDDYQRKEIDVNFKLAEILKQFPVKRVVYTGTIDSYYAGEGIINDQTPLDPYINERNFYARAKAESEKAFSNHVIVRPAIVIGEGASPFHFGVGQFSANGSICHLWGDGNNYLPLVLVEDVASGLILAGNIPNIEGQSFLLTSPPMITARDYIAALSKAMNLYIEIIPSSPFSYYSLDLVKWLVKTAIQHPNRKFPSYRDWKSRTQKALFDSSKAEQILGWMPTKDKKVLIEKGIILPAKELIL